MTIIPHNFEVAREFIMRCEISDRGYPKRKTVRYLRVRVQDTTTDNLRNRLQLAPFFESFSSDGELIVNMGFPFTPGLTEKMIDTNVLSIKVESRSTPPKNVNFTWAVTKIGDKYFTIGLDFTDLSQVSKKDIFSVQFLQPLFFYTNRRNSTLTNNS